MSLDPPGTTPADAPEDDTLIVDGLERALAQARTKIPDHDKAAEIVFPATTPAAEVARAEVAADVIVDSSAVMDVLRDAIDRYRGVEGPEQGTWVDDHPRAKANAGSPAMPRHIAAGYGPDRRRLAAVVVVLFLVVGGFGYQRFGGGGSEKVKTNTSSTSQGQAVTTLARTSTSGAVLPPPASPDTTAAPVPAVQHPATTIRRPGTTPPPSTEPPTTEPPTTDTTTTDTTEPTSTTDTTTTTTDTTVP